uniref:uncharacterized protein n=1 Tax=Centroberyx gerrardi TaxID=166262 RepID=UPI003AB06F30
MGILSIQDKVCMLMFWAPMLLCCVAEQEFFPQSSAVTWEEARNHCEVCYKDLVTLTPDNIRTIVQNLSSDYWIGLRKSLNTSSLDTSGLNTSGLNTSGPGPAMPWSRWANGDPLTFQNWYPGRPVAKPRAHSIVCGSDRDGNFHRSDRGGIFQRSDRDGNFHRSDRGGIFQRSGRDGNFHRSDRDGIFQRSDRDGNFHRSDRDGIFHRSDRDGNFHRSDRGGIFQRSDRDGNFHRSDRGGIFQRSDRDGNFHRSDRDGIFHRSDHQTATGTFTDQTATGSFTDQTVTGSSTDQTTTGSSTDQTTTVTPTELPTTVFCSLTTSDDEDGYVEDACVALLSFGPWVERDCWELLPYICYEDRFNGNISVTDLTSNSAALRWSAGPGNISSYRVEVKGDFNLTVNRSNLTYDLVNLTAGSFYSVQVFAIKCERDLNPQTHTFYTKPENVHNLTVTMVTETSVSMKWSRPVGNVDFYKIEVRGQPDLEICSTTENREVSGLTPGRLYTFHVITGVQDESEWAERVSTTAYTKPSTVSNLTVSDSRNISLQLSWEPPEGNTTGYRVTAVDCSNNNT